jgi:4-amino-4-deoxy-L-arabinose transferase-like glycosyltransferase
MKIRNLKPEIRNIIILIILAGALFLFKLGSFSLYDAAETTYGEFIKQIRLTGDWITLHYNGEIIFDKPPLYFWLATIATFIFGFNEFAVRFWAALSGVGIVALTFLLGKSFHNQRTGFLSGLVLMTSFQFLIQSRIAEIDILLTLLITSAFLFFWYGYQTNKKLFYWLMYLAASLAFLTKGLIGIALPGLAIFLFLLFKKEWKRLKDMQIIPGLLIFLLIGAPWYLVEWLLHGEKFTEFVMGFLFLSRFGGVVAGHPGPWYYYLLAVILGFAPWSHFLPYGLIRTWKSRKQSLELLSLCYIIPVFIVFSIAQTKLPSYLLPLYPFFALMVGKLWDDFLGEEQSRMRLGMMIANILLAIVVALIIIGFVILATSNYSGQYQELMPDLLLLAGILIIGSLISVGAYFLGKNKTSFTSLVVMVFAIALVLTTLTLPAVEKLKGSKELGAKVTQNIKVSEEIAAYNVGNRPSVVLYNSKPVIFLRTEDEFKSFVRIKNGYCFTTVTEYERLEKPGEIFARQGDLVVVY